MFMRSSVYFALGLALMIFQGSDQVLRIQHKLSSSILLSFLMMVFFCGTGISQVQAENDLVEEGQQYARKNCARCHSVEKTGESPFKKAPPFRTFAEKWPLESLEEALAEGIVVGHSKMPEFKLEPRQIGALISYLKSL